MGRMAWFFGKAIKGLALLIGIVVALVGLGRYVDPPVSALMVWRLAQGNGINRTWVDLDAMAAALPHAVLTAEDNRYCDHSGVDWDAVEVVLDRLGAGDARPRGASTVTMQLAKNLYLWPSRSYIRKFLEVPLAYLIDFAWPKRRIIEVYLNIVEWAPGVYGAEAAARRHFGVGAKDLTRYQAALLAAALPAPRLRNAGKPGPVTRANAARILKRMNQTRGMFGCILK